MFKSLLALSAVGSVVEARKRRRRATWRADAACYGGYSYAPYGPDCSCFDKAFQSEIDEKIAVYSYGEYWAYASHYACGYQYGYQARPRPDSVPIEVDLQCQARGIKVNGHLHLIHELEQDIAEECATGRIDEIVEQVSIISSGPQPKPPAAQPKGKGSLLAMSKGKASSGSSPQSKGKGKGKGKSSGKGKSTPSAPAWKLIDHTAGAIVGASPDDVCGTPLPGSDQRAACFKCVHDKDVGSISQCMHRHASHVARLFELHRSWELSVAEKFAKFERCDFLHNELDKEEEELAKDSKFCEECASEGTFASCSEVV